MLIDMSVKLKFILSDEECAEVLESLNASRIKPTKTVEKLKNEMNNFLEDQGYYEE